MITNRHQHHFQQSLYSVQREELECLEFNTENKFEKSQDKNYNFFLRDQIKRLEDQIIHFSLVNSEDEDITLKNQDLKDSIQKIAFMTIFQFFRRKIKLKLYNSWELLKYN